jgi:hypothetical protein
VKLHASRFGAAELRHRWRKATAARALPPAPAAFKLQCEGHDVRYRNIWIQELDLGDKGTDF